MNIHRQTAYIQKSFVVATDKEDGQETSFASKKDYLMNLEIKIRKLRITMNFEPLKEIARDTLMLLDILTDRES